MKIRRDTVFISSVLFTIAFVWMLPPLSKGALSLYDTSGRQRLEPGWRLYSEMWGAFDVACVAIVLIGLIVTWGGYVKSERWTWFVMFVIVWGWFFPTLAFHDFVYPLYRRALHIPSLLDFVAAAFSKPGIVQGVVHEMLIFALMVVALFLPVKAFFWGRGSQVAAAIRPVSEGG